MNTIKFDNKNTYVVAHRGCSGLEPENSIPAFVAAGNRSYYGIETDVHITDDGKFICIHDEETGRVAGDNINVEIASFPFVHKIVLDNICGIERLSGIKIGARKGRDDLLIPRMEDYINICKKYEKVCVLELKNRFEQDFLESVISEIRNLDYLDNVIFISFDLNNLIDLRKMLPEQRLQFLNAEYSQKVLDTLKEHKLDWDVHYSVLTKEIIDEVHANGIKINTWTVDNLEKAEELAAWGVDFITSNILEGRMDVQP